LPTDDAVERAIDNDPTLRGITRQEVQSHDFGAVYEDAPATVREKIRDIEKYAPCGGRFWIVWNNGPNKGLPLSIYCSDPLCLNDGRCSGPRFVPHYDQFTRIDADDPESRPREIDVAEIMAGIEQANQRVLKITGVRDTRSTSEKAKHVGAVWQRIKALRGSVGWGL
jgi:hypothetical protein